MSPLTRSKTKKQGQHPYQQHLQAIDKATEKAVDSIVPADTFTYTLPLGAIVGQEISVTTPSGAQVDVIVPPDVTAGDTIQVKAPPPVSRMAERLQGIEDGTINLEKRMTRAAAKAAPQEGGGGLARASPRSSAGWRRPTTRRRRRSTPRSSPTSARTRRT